MNERRAPGNRARRFRFCSVFLSEAQEFDAMTVSGYERMLNPASLTDGFRIAPEGALLRSLMQRRCWMKWISVLLLIGLIWAQCVHAQDVADPPVDEGDGVAVDAGVIADTEEDPDFRDTSAYPFPALSRTVRDMQHLAYAFQLHNYCSDDRVPDAFVRIQLARFSLITGRDETCRTLADY